MKTYHSLVFLIFFSGVCIPSTVAQSSNIGFEFSDFLHARGTDLYQNDRKVILKGVGLGGWMLQEGYMLGTSGAQHEIKQKLEDLAGKEATDQFYQDWLKYFVTENDIQQIADWGYNSIRLPMHYNLYFDASGDWLEKSKGLELTDSLLQWSKNNNLQLILDLHAAPGGQGNNHDISDRKEGESLWEDEKFQEMTVLMWAKLAEKYKDEKWIAGYDLINEINYDFENTGNLKGCSCQKNEPLLNLYKRLIDAIREVDKNHLIILEGNCYGSNYNGLESLVEYDPSKNIALSFHGYWSVNKDSAIQEMLDHRNNLNVPLWRGETGENSNTWFREMAIHMDSLEIGWANWPWKKINNLDGPVIVDPIPEWNKIVDYWADPAKPKPTEDEAQRALTEFIENIKLENTRLMHGVSHAYLDKSPAPYKEHILPGIIAMTDYDHGAYNETWFDKDYQNTSGASSNTAWNRGEKYRNDGVDIWETRVSENENQYFVGKIEDKEWLKFTLSSVVPGKYDVILRVPPHEKKSGKIELHMDENLMLSAEIPHNTEREWEEITIFEVNILKAKSLMVKFERGGYDIGNIEFIKRAG